MHKGKSIICSVTLSALNPSCDWPACARCPGGRVGTLHAVLGAPREEGPCLPLQDAHSSGLHKHPSQPHNFLSLTFFCLLWAPCLALDHGNTSPPSTFSCTCVSLGALPQGLSRARFTWHLPLYPSSGFGGATLGSRGNSLSAEMQSSTFP